MLAALESDSYSAPDWDIPAGIERVEVDRISGWPAHDEFESREEYVISGSLPDLPDEIHQKLKLCKGEDKLATDARIAANDYEEKEFIVLKEHDPFSTDGVNRWQQAIDAWIEGQGDTRYKIPTEYCGNQNEIYVKVERPSHKDNYDGNEIEVKIEADSSDGIEKLELWVDGQLRETVNSRKYETKITFSPGKHEVKAIAYSKSGDKKESEASHIGTGGVPWDFEPTPTPTATPTPTPTPTPTATPDPTPTPSPGP